MVDEDGRGIDYLVISLEQRQEQIFLKERTVKWGKNVGSVSLRITEFSRVGGPRRGGEREVFLIGCSFVLSSELSLLPVFRVPWGSGTGHSLRYIIFLG